MNFSFSPFPPSPMESFITTIIPLGFIVVFGIIIFSLIKGISQWSYNNKQPLLAVEAIVVGKRTKIRDHHAHDGDFHHHTVTLYYTTFEVESGDRMEFQIKERDFGMMAEGDRGRLTFQGTRFVSFDRNDKFRGHSIAEQ
ncbi:DUF2500 domain-containing protein [Paenibacillus profundus]|nr:DUF2500 domain-containing protein [Paenibacillus profundus]